MSVKLGLIGGGVMGEALLSRLIAQQIYQPSEVLVSDPQLQRRSYLEIQYGVGVTADNSAAIACEVLLLAIKPQVFGAIASQLADLPKSARKFSPGASKPGEFSAPAQMQPLIISILAGVPLKQLEAAFPQLPVVRAMPNTPATVGAGMTALAFGNQIAAHHKKIAQEIFSAVGQTVEVPETLMDAVTGLSGSGPAYVALFVEALSDGGVAAGLPRAIATQLALQTVRGTVEVLQQMHPAELKDRVTSPGGTTIAGVRELERAGFRSALIEAVVAATKRSLELGS